MSYSIFDELVKDQDRFASDTAQSEALVDAGNLIAEAMCIQGVTQKELARRLSVSEEYVALLFFWDENLTVRTMA